MEPTDALRECPYCKEEIKAEAIRCKHCRSSIAPEKPAHGGTCPYCKESIKSEAIKCKHCGSSVGPQCCGGCGGDEATTDPLPWRLPQSINNGSLSISDGEIKDRLRCFVTFLGCSYRCLKSGGSGCLANCSRAYEDCLISSSWI
jgi:hypothetical protein